MSSSVVVLPVVIPLAGALLALVVGRRLVSTLVVGVSVALVSTVLWLAIAVDAHGRLDHAIGGFGAPLGIVLAADGLSACMLLASGVTGAALVLHSLLHPVVAPFRREIFLSLHLFAWAALNALLLSRDVFNMYVTLELMSLSSVVLIAFGGGRAAASAALRYLLFALGGSLCYLLGVAFLYVEHGRLDADALARASTSQVAAVALVLVTGGLALKTGLFPFHGWIPATYARASAPVAALLAALLGKGSFYVLLRLWIDVFPRDARLAFGPIMSVLGSGAIVWGSLLAFRQRRLARMLAFSSVAQIGYLVACLPLGTKEGYAGSVFLAMAHSAAKGSMFVVLGNVRATLGTDRIDVMAGLARHLPLSFTALALSGVTLMGLPPSGGFIAKWLLVREAIRHSHNGLALVLLAGGLGGAAYVFRVLRTAFLPTSPDARPLGRPREGAESIALGLAFASIALGLAPSLPLGLLGLGGASR